MLKEIRDEVELQQVLRYLESDIDNCLYLYIDLVKYGLNNDSMKLWIDWKQDQIRLVVMKYHDGFQVYTREQIWEVEALLSLSERYQVTRIAGPEMVIKQLEPLLQAEYDSTYGAVFKLKKESIVPVADRSGTFADRQDLPEIARLLVATEEFGTQYSAEELLEQLQERHDTGMGRSYILRENNKIIGHVGTFAETEGIAIFSGLVLDKEHRATEYFDILDCEFANVLCKEEKKDCYFFLTNKRFIRAYSRLHEVCGFYGKLTKRGV